jgi:hypothetical protein
VGAQSRCSKSSTNGCVLEPQTEHKEASYRASHCYPGWNMKRLALLVPVSEVQRTARDFDLSNLSRSISTLLVCRHVIRLPLHEARDVLENRCRRLASKANSAQNPYPLVARVLAQVTVFLLDVYLAEHGGHWFGDVIAPHAECHTVQPLRSVNSSRRRSFLQHHIWCQSMD